MTDAGTRPDALKQWIADNVKVPVTRQILMTAQGKNVKQQHLVDQGHVFIYDKQFLARDEEDTVQNDDAPTEPTLREAPSELENETSLPAWQQLFKTRRAWTLGAVDIVRDLATEIIHISEACENIDRSTRVALDNLRNHVISLESSFQKTQAWAQDTLQEHTDMLREWQAMANALKELPIREDIGRLMVPSTADRVSTDSVGTMYALLDIQALKEANTVLESSSSNFQTHVKGLTSSIGELNKESSAAAEMAQIDWPNLDSENLLQEAETLAQKVSADYEDALRAGSDTRAISRISRVAAEHTNNLLPGLQDVVAEAIQVRQNAWEHRSRLSKMCFRVLREISRIQSTLAALQNQLSTLALSEDGQNSLETLDRTFRLPSAYGSILIEAIRRSEWNDRIVADLKALKDELSQHKEDELKRRRKWTNTMSGFLCDDSVSAHAISDFSFSTPANPWPFVSREEIFGYIDDLRALEINDAVEQVTQGLRDLDTPAKTRRLRPKPFKNGSIHDTMQNSFMRNGDDMRSLQDDKQRLEDKLRASESRIRKLEGLVHQQSQANRPVSGIFTPITEFDRQMSSPDPARPAEFPSRRSSVSARRLSNQNLDEKAMAQRIISLETQISRLQQEAHAERRSSTEHREKMQEAESVKRDLMANFDAQRQEFDEERQRLEDDNHELKIRLEVIEEELDRVSGSRDHERMKQEKAISHFRSELERLRKSTNEEIDHLREAKNTLSHDLNLQRERSLTLDKELHRLRDERSNLQTHNMALANDLRKMESQRQEITGTLQAVHSHLSPAGSAPDDINKLANTLEVLAEGATFHARGLEDELQLNIAQSKAAEEKIIQLESQVDEAKFAHQEKEMLICEKDEKLRELQHILEGSRAELAEERSQVEHLRAQFAAGETGSDTLRARLAEEEQRVEELTQAKTKLETQIDNLQQSSNSLRDEISSLNKAVDAAKEHLASREQKARDLSERLFQHNDRVIRMVENFGYSVSRPESSDTFQIQRASKVNASTILAGVSSSIADISGTTPTKRQVSGSMLGPQVHFSDVSDAESLYWTSSSPSNENEKYTTFISALSRLNLDSTIELLTKRYKDIETMAKKYQKATHSARDKTHRLQSEAHDKIAYRSFKEGDLALFLPTRDRAKAWAAFNVGAPHYFLREQDAHRLQSRDWLLARINKISTRTVDLAKSMGPVSTNANADGDGDEDEEDDNPFDLSDGLRWYLIDATEEKSGAPTTPGLGKSTVAASVVSVDAQPRKSSAVHARDGDKVASAVAATKTLHKSLDSRRSSGASRKSGTRPVLKTSSSKDGTLAPLTNAATTTVPATAGRDMDEAVSSPAVEAPTPTYGGTGMPNIPTIKPSESSLRPVGEAREDAGIFDVVRRDLIFGPDIH